MRVFVYSLHSKLPLSLIHVSNSVTRYLRTDISGTLIGHFDATVFDKEISRVHIYYIQVYIYTMCMLTTVWSGIGISEC